MAIDKKIDYVEQDGSLNFVKNSESVTVPKKFKARKEAPTVKLAYITDAEAKMLKKKKPGTPHKGPKGIPSYDSFGSIDRDTGRDTGVSGSQVSAAETGGGGSGMSSQDRDDFRSAAIAAGAGQRVNPGFFDDRNTVSRAELLRAKTFNPAAFRAGRRGGIMDFFTGGGFLGNILRGLGQKFGLGKRFNEPYDRPQFAPGFATNPLQMQYDVGNEGLLSLLEDEEETDRPLRTSTFFDDPSIDRLGSPDRFISPLDKEGFQMDDTRTVIRNPNFSGNVNIPFGGTVLYDEFPSTEIDYGNPRNDSRVVPEEMGLVGDRGIMSVTRSDIAPQFQDMVRQVAMNEAQKKKALQEMEFGVAPEKIMPKLQQLDDTKFFMKTDDAIKANDLIKFYEDRGVKLSDEQKMKIVRAAGEDV